MSVSYFCLMLYLVETIPVNIMLHHDTKILPAYIVHQAFILFCAVYLSGHVEFRFDTGDYKLKPQQNP